MVLTRGCVSLTLLFLNGYILPTAKQSKKRLAFSLVKIIRKGQQCSSLFSKCAIESPAPFSSDGDGGLVTMEGSLRLQRTEPAQSCTASCGDRGWAGCVARLVSQCDMYGTRKCKENVKLDIVWVWVWCWVSFERNEFNLSGEVKCEV